MKALIEAGPGELERVINAFWEKQVEAIRRYVQAEIPDVSTFCQRLGLTFNLARFLEEALKKPSRSATLNLARVGAVQERTLIVAAGRDYETAQHLIARNPTLYRDVELVRGATGLAVSVSSRMQNLPLSVLPAWADAERALRNFPAPGPGLAVFDEICSTGHLLEAYSDLLSQGAKDDGLPLDVPGRASFMALPVDRESVNSEV